MRIYVCAAVVAISGLFGLSAQAAPVSSMAAALNQVSSGAERVRECWYCGGYYSRQRERRRHDWGNDRWRGSYRNHGDYGGARAYYRRDGGYDPWRGSYRRRGGGSVLIDEGPALNPVRE